ncbi:hypothetical protein D3C73_1343440 [compost metagenome]
MKFELSLNAADVHHHFGKLQHTELSRTADVDRLACGLGLMSAEDSCLYRIIDIHEGTGVRISV